ncbi:hypothetical protein HDU96_001586, partial [Phlyctochytrium bullatum]
MATTALGHKDVLLLDATAVSAVHSSIDDTFSQLVHEFKKIPANLLPPLYRPFRQPAGSILPSIQDLLLLFPAEMRPDLLPPTDDPTSFVLEPVSPPRGRKKNDRPGAVRDRPDHTCLSNNLKPSHHSTQNSIESPLPSRPQVVLKATPEQGRKELILDKPAVAALQSSIDDVFSQLVHEFDKIPAELLPPG